MAFTTSEMRRDPHKHSNIRIYLNEKCFNCVALVFVLVVLSISDKNMMIYDTVGRAMPIDVY